MLSGETAVGRHPARAVRAMAEIAHTTQCAAPIRLETIDPARDYREAVVRSAVHLAQQTRAAAIVVPTRTGAAARAAARCSRRG